MTTDIFDSVGNIENLTAMRSLLVQVSTAASEIDTYSNTFKNKPLGHSQFQVKSSKKLKSGELTHCRQTFGAFGTSFEWLHFMHNDRWRYWNTIQERLLLAGYLPAHEWWFSYMYPGAHFERHVDAIEPLVRFSAVIMQAPTSSSIRVGETDYVFQVGDTYLMSGEVPHEVINRSSEPRLMLLGAIAI